MSPPVDRRRPLTEAEREFMAERLQKGDRSWVRLENEDCPIDVEAHPGHMDTGGVSVAGLKGMLTPDESRLLATNLLALADHAEFGPGSWLEGKWHPRRVPAPHDPAKDGPEKS